MDPTLSDLRLSSRARRRRASPIRELIPYMALEDMISLGGGYPNPDTFPIGELRVVLKGESPRELVIAGDALARAQQYGATEGAPGLLELLRSWHLAKDDVRLGPGELMVLNGSQEGLYLAADVLLDEGEEVLLSEPSYPGAVAALRSFGARLTTVPLDGDGLRVDLLAELLERRREAGAPLPRLVYTIPNGHNPAGVSLSVERRRALAALAQEHDLLLLEDDPYQLVRLQPGPPLPTLQSLAPERVLRLDSFSKILCPGLRIGYVSGPAPLVRAMALHKQASNLQTGSLTQAVLAAYLDALGNDGLLRHVDTVVRRYTTQRDAMVTAARRHLPASVSFEVPQAGMFLWLRLPTGCDAQRMIDADCEALKVLLVPGAAFSTTGGCTDALRASYSLVSPERLDEGMRRLALMLGRELARAGAPGPAGDSGTGSAGR